MRGVGEGGGGRMQLIFLHASLLQQEICGDLIYKSRRLFDNNNLPFVISMWMLFDNNDFSKQLK